MEIPEIRIKGGDIDTIRVPFTPDYLTQPPQTIQIGTPVTNQIGVPIVDVPGCVEAHQVDENNMLEGDDPKGVRVYCDGQQPSFNPIDYNKEDLQFTGEAEVPAIPPPKDLEVDAPEIPKKTVTKEIKCPTEAQQLKQPIGTLVKDGKETQLQGYYRKRTKDTGPYLQLISRGTMLNWQDISNEIDYNKFSPGA